MEFSYFLPVHIQFGWDKVDSVADFVKPYGNKALIVTGRISAKKSGLYDRVTAKLDAAHIEHVLFDQVDANPLTTTALDGATLAKSESCDMVIAIGGGSIMDCAKGIAFMAVNEGDINDYIFNRKTSDKALPLIVIPTTCGTGSEGNGFGVLTNPETGDKKSLRCNAIVPKVSIVDPAVMGTMPPHVLASVGFDALCHNIEAYTSKTAQPFTDALAHYAVTLLAQYLVPLYKHVKAMAESKAAVLNETQLTKAWESVTLASTIGGMVINTAGVTLAHGMEHPASGLKNITHGVGLAVIEPVAVEYTWSANPDKFGALARIFNHGDGSELGEALRLIVHDLDLTTNLTELGFTKKDIPWLVDNVYVVATGNIANTVAEISRKDIEVLYKKMF
ncbi:iron-containing alcohol dehydrogenase [Veillonella parvula]|uniref:iron-containing alcohol dehydrogenase n=1 Tax=Veillonella parvula TaxID=29466 RepID=UPI001D074A45|nr:iron-containing alcohol dehydrogenase [Veillonella parvula]MCB6805325.1 iron-containing alcohol dehydrogenase [Veillonella parvula]MCQ4927294.1 iron-containing alcohol dehydrogenase [Veillonella parvula]MCQ4958483.1 iron-containing alcohol dehydrogenase [Veillonella parvula]